MPQNQFASPLSQPRRGRFNSSLVIGLIVLALPSLVLFLPGGGEWWPVAAPADRLDRHAVSGTVTRGGRPMNDGVIEFIPQMIRAEEGDFTEAAAVIRDGSFAIAAHEGLVPGLYLLRISVDGDEVILLNQPNIEATRLMTLRVEGGMQWRLFVNVRKRQANELRIDLP